jgi:tetratricopeptide (TPR) repeat protein
MPEKNKKLKIEMQESSPEEKEPESETMKEQKEISKQAEMPKAGKKFLKVARFSVYALIFLLPLFFLPWTSNVLDFNKQTLLLFLVFISLICWLASALISNKLEINTSFLNLPVLTLVLTGGVAVIFSLSRYGSFWGWPLAVSSGFISLVEFVVIYFLIANLFKKDEILFLFLALFVSGFFAALYFIFQLFGKFILPFDFAKNLSFNTIGTVNSLAIYFSLLLVLLVPLFFFVSRFFKIILGIIGATLLISLFLINFKTAWLIFLVGFVVLFVFGVVNLRRTGRSGFITLTMALLIIASLLLFFRFPLPGVPQIPAEVSPSQGASFNILKSLPAKSLILGTGQGTFIYDWSKYKSPAINQSVFWNVRFGQASSEVLDRLIGNGILGILAFFFLIAIFFKLVFEFFLKKMESRIVKEGKSPTKQEILSWLLIWATLACFTGLVAVFFLYSANLSISFLFWLLIGCSTLLGKGKRKTFDFGASSVSALSFSFFFILVLVLGIGLSILYGQKYAAEVRYFQGWQAWQKGDLTLSINYISRAANLNPKMDIYWRNLSQMYLVGLNEVLARTDLKQEEKNNQAQNLIASSINSATQATIVEPNNAANWNTRGFVYRNMLGILAGADEWAVKSYQKAAELEPNNPNAFAEIGLVYLTQSDILAQQKKDKERDGALKLAQDNFEKAIKLKSDYAPALYQLAMIRVREGKNQEAIDQLESAQQVAPSDTGIAFQLGVLYYNSGESDNARIEFERAVLLDPKYSNARYFLGLIYDKKGNRSGAIEQFEKIAEFNPDNQDIQKILINLRAGKSALEGVVPGQPPLEEKPAERLKK